MEMETEMTDLMTAPAQPEFFLQAYGSIALERLDIAIWDKSTTRVDETCTRMIQALVLAGYHRFDLYDPQTNKHIRKYSVEVQKPVVTPHYPNTRD